jgi:hypothetical protein
MFKTTVAVFLGLLLAVGAFLYIRMEVRDHKRLNDVIEFLNSQIQKSAQPLPTQTK